MAPTDLVVRAITDDGAFRVITTRTTEMVRGAAAAQGVTGAPATRFGELLTGAVLVREAMAPQLRVQAILKSGKGTIVADSHPDGVTRGLVNAAAKVDAPLEKEGGLLQVMRTLPNGMLHQGVVAVPSPGGVSDALMAYLQESEQVVSVIAVGATRVGEGEVTAAGGFLVQLLPEVERGPLMIMIERLQAGIGLDDLLRGGAGAEEILAEVLYGMPHSRVGEGPVAFDCRCSETRLLASLATLPHADIEEMLASGEPLGIRCDYCGREYAVPAETLRAAVTSN